MEVGEEHFAYQSWFTSHVVAWRDVTAVVHAQNLPHPRDRNYGPAAYEVRTPQERFVVTLLYFAPEACRAFQAGTERRKELRRVQG